MPSSGHLFILMGPSGTGKTTQQEMLVSDKTLDHIVRSISATTRSPKKGETEGKDYFFMDEETFHEKKSQDVFYESSLYDNHWYGMPRKFVDDNLRKGSDVVAVIEVKGVQRIIKKFREEKRRKSLVVVGYYPKQFADIPVRLFGRDIQDVAPEERAKKEAGALARLTIGTEEIQCINIADYLICVEHNNPKAAYDILHSIVIAERAKEKVLDKYLSGYLRDYARYCKSKKAN